MKKIIVVMILLIIAGCKDEKIEYEPIPEYQTSEYEWHGDPFSLLQAILPEGKDVAGWQICCPKCDGSPNILRLGTVTLERKIGATAEVPYQWYCGDCYYPLGTDWKIIDLSEPNGN